MAIKVDTIIQIKEVVGWLTALQFTPVDGEINIYSKNYTSSVITVDIPNNSIKYPSELVIHDKATSNLSKRENLVVLDCIDRLLLKGYKPECIEIEKTWKLGHKGKGRLDILVTDHNKDAFLMIECKTWGKEYNHEMQKMYTDGGQLISYYPKASATQYLCLYSSTVSGNKIEYINSIISVTNELASTKSSESFFEKWDRSFQSKGIFEKGILPYKIEFKGLRYDDYNNLENDSSGLIFNQFAEILRRNTVSDKSNAFNKIFNLFHL